MMKPQSIVCFFLLSAGTCAAQSSYQGLTPGTSTRTEVERSFGQPVRSNGRVSEYHAPASSELASITVQYRMGSDIAEQIEVYFPSPVDRSALIRTLGLPEKPETTKVEDAKLVEYFGPPPLLVLRYGAANQTDGVSSVGYYSRESFGREVIEYLDKLLGSGEKIDLATRLATLSKRSWAFEVCFNDQDPDANEQLQRARDAADLGLKLLGQWQRPQTLTNEQYAQQKKYAASQFNHAGAFAALKQKDYKAAIGYCRASLAVGGPDPVTYYRLGIALLLESPPQSVDGLWALARAVALKGSVEMQARDYLRKSLLFFQQPGCEALIDPQMNEMIQLAATSPERPSTYRIPSAADLDKARQSSTILTILAGLESGGATAKMTWLAVCGSELPDVVAKIIQVTPGANSVHLEVFTAGSQQEIIDATTPNMDVNLMGQPNVQQLQKDDGIRFSGTLVGYDAQPFLLHWDKVKIKESYIRH